MILSGGLEQIQALPRVLALGNFDGLHRGHQLLIKHAVEAAKDLGVRAAALAFDPHPQEILHPERAPKLLSFPADRARLMAAIGLEELIIVHFDLAFSKMPAEEFITDILVERCCVRQVYVGAGYRFGYRGQGDVALLRQSGAKLGFAVHELPLLPEGGEVISSSAIRQALQAGELQRALTMLGHDYSLCGVVEHGTELARKLGFPTANLKVSPRCLLPRYGVYQGEVTYRDKNYPAVVNIGERPSVGGTAVSVEAHLLDFSGDLYGEQLCLTLRRFLRPEQRFANLQELQAQVLQDIEQVHQEVFPCPN